MRQAPKGPKATKSIPLLLNPTRWRRVAIYARVSTDGQSVDQQVDALERWLGPRAGEVKVFKETASGAGERPVLEDLLVRVRRREFSAIACWKFDRIARRARELVMLLDEVQALGVDLVSYTENLDTSTPTGKAVFQILAAVGELERNLISERTKARLAFVKASGVKLGRRPKNVDMDKARWLIVRMGYPTRLVAKRLKVSVGKASAVMHAILAEPGASKKRKAAVAKRTAQKIAARDRYYDARRAHGR